MHVCKCVRLYLHVGMSICMQIFSCGHMGVCERERVCVCLLVFILSVPVFILPVYEYADLAVFLSACLCLYMCVCVYVWF